MKYKKIIYVREHPYAIRDHHRLGADYLEKCGYCVEIWRIMCGKSINIEFTAGMYRGDNYKEISKDEYHIEISNDIESVLYIFFGKSRLLVDAALNGCRYICVDGIGGVVVPDQSELNSVANIKPVSPISAFIKHLKGGLLNYLRFRLNKVSDFYVQKKTRDILNAHPPIILITSTLYASRIYLSDDFVCSVKCIHSMDYDRYIETERENRTPEHKHILYCDSGFFNKNQDWMLCGRNNGREYAKEYQEQLELLFKRLEDHYGLPVVIAGHPHAEYSKKDFAGRNIVFDQTCNLAKDAVAFITTTSTAMNFALLYNVPSLKIVNSYMKEIRYPYENSSDLYAYIQYEASNVFGCGFLDMDDIESMKSPWDFVKSFEQEKREDYIKKYIIDNNTTDRTLIEYIVDGLLI